MARCFSEFYYHLIKNILYIIDCHHPFSPLQYITRPSRGSNPPTATSKDFLSRVIKHNCRPGRLSLARKGGEGGRERKIKRGASCLVMRIRSEKEGSEGRTRAQGREREIYRGERGEHMVKTRKVSASINSDDRDERATAPRSISLSIALGSVAR